MSDPQIIEEIEGSKGRYVIKTEQGEAEMTFSIASPGMRIVDHTAVPKALEGQGFAFQLFQHLTAKAAEEGWKILPLCPYVNRQRAKHPELARLFQV